MADGIAYGPEANEGYFIMPGYFGHCCGFHVQNSRLSRGKSRQGLLIAGSFGAKRQDRSDMILDQEIGERIRDPELENLFGKHCTHAHGKTDNPGLQVRMKASCKTEKYKKIGGGPRQFDSKRFLGRFCSHAAFDQDDLFAGQFEGELLRGPLSHKTPGRKKLF